MPYYGCQDSRMLTSWVPASDVEVDLKNSMNATDEYSYRLALQKNAKKIMEQNSRYYMNVGKMCSCPKCTYKNLLPKKN